MSVKVGFIGTGWVSNIHLEALSKIDGVQFKAMCDLSEERVREAAQKYGGNVYTDHHRMFDKEDLDAVYICLPPFAHTDQEIIAAQKGISLFVEKPLAVTLEKADEIGKVIEEAGVISSVGYMYRYLDLVDEVKDLIKDKKIAIVLGRRFSFVPGVDWSRVKAKSGGQIVDQSTHIFDLARYLVGEVDKVQAYGFRGLMTDKENYDLEDASTVTLYFKEGTIGNISSNFLLSKGSVEELEMVLKELRIVLSLSSNTLRISNSSENQIEGKGVNEAYFLENQIFMEAVKTRDASKIRSPYSDALKTHRLTIRANESMEKAKTISV